MEDAIVHVQAWYAEKMGGLTFRLHSVTPTHCTLENEADYYAWEGGYNRVVYDLQHCVPIWWEQPYNVWAVYPDVLGECGKSELGRGGYGITILHKDDLEGISKPEGHTHCSFFRAHMTWYGGLAHELGHAFGLPHPPGCDEGLDTCDWKAMMQLGYNDYPNTYLRADETEFLQASGWFDYRLEE